MTLHKLMKFVEDTHVEKAESNLSIFTVHHILLFAGQLVESYF